MKGRKEETNLISRRNMLMGSAVFLCGGAVGSFSNAYSASTAAPAAGNAPPLPWPWVKLDPLEAGRRAYKSYLKNKG